MLEMLFQDAGGDPGRGPEAARPLSPLQTGIITASQGIGCWPVYSESSFCHKEQKISSDGIADCTDGQKDHMTKQILHKL